MLMRTILIAVLVADAAEANSHQMRRHRPPATIVEAPPYAGTLVLYAAWNVACMSHDRARRALPCEQRAWVYENPCEIDLGLGHCRPRY